MSARLTRRGFVAASGMIAAAAGSGVSAMELGEPSVSLLLTHQAYRAEVRKFAQGQPVIVLAADVVRHWRAGLGAEVQAAANVRAYVPWAEALVLEGLAREHGGKIRMSRSGPLHCLDLTFTAL